ncbi:MAG: diguanylate cyclase/phosphodiesterase domain 1 [Myxococcaceae bacterium]|nr:diguanylate cyclase/phosphodiesterase domain 1 [Myxococcaceae bacterium]
MSEKLRRRWMGASLLYPFAAAAFTVGLSVLLIGLQESPLRATVICGALLVAALGGIATARREAAVTSLCTVDALTGLPNRRYFEQSLQRELVRAQRTGAPIALLVIDVDALKTINDRLGHHAGDAAIRVVADALRGTCRGSDLPARWGGDEFAVLAPNTDAEQAQALVQRITAALPLQSAVGHAEARIKGQPCAAVVSASIGFAIGSAAQPVTLWPGTLFGAADRAMYRVKCSRTPGRRGLPRRLLEWK